jgi:DNA-binding transcriptional MerR regulator
VIHVGWRDTGSRGYIARHRRLFSSYPPQRQDFAPHHNVGLLVPADVDPGTGYRRYTTDQVPTAQVIRRFRDLDMPLEDIGEVLRAPDPRTRNDLVTRHLSLVWSKGWLGLRRQLHRFVIFWRVHHHRSSFRTATTPPHRWRPSQMW